MEAFLKVSSGIICGVKLYGDFFGEYDVAEIEDALKGTKHNENAVRQRLSTFELNRYFAGISEDELISVLV